MPQTIVQSVQLKETLKGSSGKKYLAKMRFVAPNIPEELLAEIDALPSWKLNQVMLVEFSVLPDGDDGKTDSPTGEKASALAKLRKGKAK